MTQDWAIRPAVPEDLNFIYDSWMDTVQYKTSIPQGMTRTIFKKEYLKVVDHLLDQSTILIATLPGTPFLIMGYGVASKGILHMLYVKQIFRQVGIGKNLYEHLEKPTITTLCTQPYGRSLLEKYPHITYNPFLLYNQGDSNGQRTQEISTCEISPSVCGVGFDGVQNFSKS